MEETLLDRLSFRRFVGLGLEEEAAAIARFAQAVRPQPRLVPSDEAKALAELVARRRQVIEMAVAERNRRRLVKAKVVLRSIDRVLAALERQLADLDDDIGRQVRETPAWREKEDLLKSVPGVGDQTARTLIAALPERTKLAAAAP